MGELPSLIGEALGPPSLGLFSLLGVTQFPLYRGP